VGEAPERKVKFLPVPSGVITQPPGAAAKNLPRCSARQIIYLDAVAECNSGVYFARAVCTPGCVCVCSLNFVRLIIYENCLNNENFAACVKRKERAQRWRQLSR
jgi:hypothetical protein